MAKMDYSIVGKRFGSLTVLDLDHVGKNGLSFWTCDCDCGNRTVVSRNALITGKTKSCGCSRYLSQVKDIAGMRFGRLTVLAFDHISPSGNSCWLCECDCGNYTVVRQSSLSSGDTTSCGCYARELARARHTTHGLSHDPLFTVWVDMLQRCQNENSKGYENYGGRGIRVCDEWNDFTTFYNWAMDSGYERGLTIDRIDVNYNYCPENCRWTDWYGQANNKRNNRNVSFNGETHTIGEWSRIFGVKYITLRARINRGDMRDFEKYFEECE